RHPRAPRTRGWRRRSIDRRGRGSLPVVSFDVDLDELRSGDVVLTHERIEPPNRHFDRGDQIVRAGLRQRQPRPVPQALERHAQEAVALARGRTDDREVLQAVELCVAAYAVGIVRLRVEGVDAARFADGPGGDEGVKPDVSADVQYRV